MSSMGCIPDTFPLRSWLFADSNGSQRKDRYEEGGNGEEDRSRPLRATDTADDRPFLVGYRERPLAVLPAAIGRPHGG